MAFAAAQATAVVTAAGLASASILASCSRKAASSSKPQPSGQTLPASALPAENPAQAAPKPEPPAAPPAPLAASVRGFGLGAPSQPRLPWDYSLGPLQTSRPAEGDEADVYSIATSFLKGLGEGKLDADLLLPQSRDALTAILAPAPTDRGSAGGPAKPYRLGAIVVRGPDASLKLRLPAAAGEPLVEGLLSLRKVDDTWYVEALALDPPEDGPLAFNPDANAGGGAQRR